MDRVVIGICGRKRSGKDEIAKSLVDGYGFKRVAFADALKRACATVFKLTHDELYGDRKENAIVLQNRVSKKDVVILALHAAVDVYHLQRVYDDGACDVPMMTWGGLTASEIIDRFTAGCLSVWSSNLVSPRQVLQWIGTGVCRDQIHYQTWIKSLVLTIAEDKDQEYWVIPDVRFKNEIKAVREMSRRGVIVRVDKPSLPKQKDLHPSEVEWQSVQPDEQIVNGSSLSDLREMAMAVALDIIAR